MNVAIEVGRLVLKQHVDAIPDQDILDSAPYAAASKMHDASRILTPNGGALPCIQSTADAYLHIRDARKLIQDWAKLRMFPEGGGDSDAEKKR